MANSDFIILIPQLADGALGRGGRHGFPPLQARNGSAVAAFVARMAADFDLVMIAEHFVESVVLLRRQLCWTWQDVVYLRLNRNAKKTGDDLAVVEPKLAAFYRNYSNVDYALYAHFNRTFWATVAREKDFSKEVDAIRPMLDNVAAFCASKAAKLVVPASEWTAAFSLTPADCQRLKIMPERWTPLLWSKMAERSAGIKSQLNN